MEKVIFIGAGSMAEAMLNGWLTTRRFAPEQLYVSNRSNTARLTALQQTYGVNVLTSYEELRDATYIVLAMKPKDARAALAAIAPYLAATTQVLSVLAGISIETIASFVGERPIARAMPNTSAKVGMSATGIAFNTQTTPAQRAQFIALMEAVGIVQEVAEDKLHAITALAGSGPAYLYYLLEAFEAVAVEYGLAGEDVRQLMVQTMAGSARMMQQLKEEPATLRQQVTSPGGTTEAGIAALQANQFSETIAEAIRRAEQRSRQLANEKE